MSRVLYCELKIGIGRGAWVAPLVEHATLFFRDFIYFRESVIYLFILERVLARGGTEGEGRAENLKQTTH